MFKFLSRSAARYPTIRETLAEAGVPSAADPAGLTVLERMGSYSGRRVNFFRAFDPRGAAARSVSVHGFRDLDGHPDLLLGSGHVEHEGLVMLDDRAEAEHSVPDRALADRADHTDDERFVFRNGSITPVAAPPIPG
jgi:hypothetical protein